MLLMGQNIDSFLGPATRERWRQFAAVLQACCPASRPPNVRNNPELELQNRAEAGCSRATQNQTMRIPVQRRHGVLLFLFCLPLFLHCVSEVRSQPVDIPDPALRFAIWVSLGRSGPVGDLTVRDMLSLTSLYAYSKGIHSIDGLEHAINLSELDLSWNGFTSLTLPAGRVPSVSV